MDIHCFANGEKNFAKVSEEEIEEAVFYPSDLVNTKTTIPLGVGEEWWIYTLTLHVSVYIHHYSPPRRRIVVYCTINGGVINQFCLLLQTIQRRMLQVEGRVLNNLETTSLRSKCFCGVLE